MTLRICAMWGYSLQGRVPFAERAAELSQGTIIVNWRRFNNHEHLPLAGLNLIRIVRLRSNVYPKMAYFALPEREIPLNAPVPKSTIFNELSDHLWVYGVTEKGKEKRVYACPFSPENLEALQEEIGQFLHGDTTP